MFCDNYFSSVKLAADLLKDNIYLTATTKRPLLDFRMELVKGLVGNFFSRKQATPNQRVQEGHWSFLILKDGGSGASRIKLNGAQWLVRNVIRICLPRFKNHCAKLTWLDVVISNLLEHSSQNAFIYFVILFKCV